MRLKFVNTEYPECYFPEHMIEQDEDSYNKYLEIDFIEDLFELCNYDDPYFVIYIKDGEYCLELQ